MADDAQLFDLDGVDASRVFIQRQRAAAHEAADEDNVAAMASLGRVRVAVLGVDDEMRVPVDQVEAGGVPGADCHNLASARKAPVGHERARNDVMQFMERRERLAVQVNGGREEQEQGCGKRSHRGNCIKSRRSASLPFLVVVCAGGKIV